MTDRKTQSVQPLIPMSPSGHRPCFNSGKWTDNHCREAWLARQGKTVFLRCVFTFIQVSRHLSIGVISSEPVCLEILCWGCCVASHFQYFHQHSTKYTHTQKQKYFFSFFCESVALQLPAAVGWSCLSVAQHRSVRLLAPQLSSV